MFRPALLRCRNVAIIWPWLNVFFIHENNHATDVLTLPAKELVENYGELFL